MNNRQNKDSYIPANANTLATLPKVITLSIFGFFSPNYIGRNIACLNKSTNSICMNTHDLIVKEYQFLVKGHKILNEHSHLFEKDKSNLDSTAWRLIKSLKKYTGLMALGEGLITISDVMRFRHIENYVKLSIALRVSKETANGKYFLKALREKLLKVDDLFDLTSEDLDYLLTVNGLLALKEKLLTVADIKNLRQSKKTQLLDLFLTFSGIEALRNKEINFEQAIEMNNLAFQDYFKQLKVKYPEPASVCNLKATTILPALP